MTIARVDDETGEPPSLHQCVAVAMDAYAAFLVGACHTLGSPLGALLSNVSLAREDLSELLRAVRDGTQDQKQLLPILERVDADLGDAQGLIDRLKQILIEVRSAPSTEGEDASTALLDVFESAVKFAASSTFRGARVTTKVDHEGNREEFVVRGDGSLVLKLILGAFSVAASTQGEQAERAVFHIDVSRSRERVHIRIEGQGGLRVDLARFFTFAQLFTRQGGSLTRDERPDSCVVLADFARYAEH